jgi:hypothetical protein
MRDESAPCAEKRTEIRMGISILVVAALLWSSAIADSCVTLEGPTLANKCQTCMEVTVRELRPRGEQATGMFASEPRSIRLEAGASSTVQGANRSAITDLKACQ